MTTQPLLTISAFARAVDLAPSTLRYYDECGLLPPTEVDGRTGYRYYTPDLSRRAHLVRRMREMGVPVETMRSVLDGPPEDAVELLRGYAERAAQSARQVAEALDDVTAALRGEAYDAEPVVVPVDGPQLGVALTRVAAAADADPASPLAVVLLDVAGPQVTVVATDRYWMAHWVLSTGASAVGASAEGRVVLPASGVAPLSSWLARTGTVTVSATPGTKPRLRLTTGDDAWDVDLSEDRFPAYRMVLGAQQPPTGRLTLDRDRLLEALSRTTGPVRLSVGDDRLRISAHGAAEGVHLDAVTVGSAAVLGFSPELLAAAVRASVGTVVSLEYAAPDRAVRVTSPEQRAFTALVMPTAL